jgi:hypothetical protein
LVGSVKIREGSGAMWRSAVAAALAAVLAGAAGYCAGKYRAPKSPTGHLRHVVVWLCGEDAAPEKIKELEDAFLALRSKIPGIERFESGPILTPAPTSATTGYIRCFLLTFKDAQARDEFWRHPAYVELQRIRHEEYGQAYGPMRQYDFISEDAPRNESR